MSVETMGLLTSQDACGSLLAGSPTDVQQCGHIRETMRFKSWHDSDAFDHNTSKQYSSNSDISISISI